MFAVLLTVAGFLLGLRAGIEIGYRRAKKRLLKSSDGTLSR
jgi:hypothetical protein